MRDIEALRTLAPYVCVPFFAIACVKDEVLGYLFDVPDEHETAFLISQFVLFSIFIYIVLTYVTEFGEFCPSNVEILLTYEFYWIFSIDHVNDINLYISIGYVSFIITWAKLSEFVFRYATYGARPGTREILPLPLIVTA
jgi:hypothetical protein